MEEILAELGEVQDRLLEVEADDYATRAELSNRQDALRLEARQARDEVSVDDLGLEQLEREIAHLEAELERYLGTRPSASAGSGGGGPGGGGIDPGFLHAMHRQMDSSFGYTAKEDRLQTLRVRLEELRAAGGDSPPTAPLGRRGGLWRVLAGAALVGALVLMIVVFGGSDSPSVTTIGPGPVVGERLIPDNAAVLVTAGHGVVMFDGRGRALAESGAVGELTLNHRAGVAYGDHASGLVYLEATGWQVRHWPDSLAPATTVVGAGERGVQLFDVTALDGRLHILVGVPHDVGDDNRTLLALVDLETFDISPVGSYGLTPGGGRRQIMAASYAEDHILASVRNQDDWWFELYNLEGSDDERGLPYHADQPGSRVAHGVLSPDATTMAYVDGGTVVVRDLAARAELGSWPVDDAGFDGVERIDYDGTLITVSFGDRSEPRLINTTTGTLTPLTAVGIATFIDR